ASWSPRLFRCAASAREGAWMRNAMHPTRSRRLKLTGQSQFAASDRCIALRIHAPYNAAFDIFRPRSKLWRIFSIVSIMMSTNHDLNHPYKEISMRSLVVGFAVLSVAFIMFSGATGQEKGKEVTVKGTITCAKCDLQVEKKCATVIVTKDKEKDKDVTIYFD